MSARPPAASLRRRRPARGGTSRRREPAAAPAGRSAGRALRRATRGRTNRQTAEALFITQKTASVHVSNILGKLGAANRGEAAALAHRAGFDLPAAAPA